MLNINRIIRPAITLVVMVQLVLLLSGCGTASLSSHSTGSSAQVARNVILIIGDGMQLEHENAANNYLFGNDRRGLSFWEFPYQGQTTTWDITTYNTYALAAGKAPWDAASSTSTDSTTFTAIWGYDPAQGGKLPYPLDVTGNAAYLTGAATDSAAAGTALATGYKTDAGNIAWKSADPEDGRLHTIAEMLRDQKQGAIGVVTTVPFSHATPAAFVSHNKSRNNYQEIAAEIINAVKPEVVIGGGHPAYNANYLSSADYTILRNSTDYLLAERQSGVDGNTTITALASEAATRGRKLFGLFGNSAGHFDYPLVAATPGAPDVVRGNTENPSLAAAATAALQVLSQNRNGFFLMVEQGDIDWANHANDFRSMVGGVHDLHEAVKAIDRYIDQPGDDLDWSNTLVIVTSDHGNSYMRLNRAKPLQKGQLPRQEANNVAVGPYTPGFIYPNGEVSYASGSHTNELIRVYARGAGTNLLSSFEGSWYAGTKIIDNTMIFQAMRIALGLTDQN